MFLTVEVPDDGKDVKVTVLCKRQKYHLNRYSPGHWNGLNGGTHYGQYFDMDDVDRVRDMIDVASVLAERGIKYSLSKLKRNYRIMITRKDYFSMDEALRRRIIGISFRHEKKGGM